MILAVDAGNTRIKWALHDGSAFVSEGWATISGVGSLDAQWTALPGISRTVIANVAGEAVARELDDLARRRSDAVHWAASAKSQAGVTNHYEDPHQLGVDRWAALIGARSLTQANCVVVNAGTAMTVDALTSRGDFLGGFILPGFDLMRESLAAKAAKIASESGRFIDFPRTTRDAIASGSIHALCGAVEYMRGAMISAGHDNPEVVLSGGSAELVAVELGLPVRHADKLVLLGLVQIAKELR